MARALTVAIDTGIIVRSRFSKKSRKSHEARNRYFGAPRQRMDARCVQDLAHLLLGHTSERKGQKSGLQTMRTRERLLCFVPVEKSASQPSCWGAVCVFAHQPERWQHMRGVQQGSMCEREAHLMCMLIEECACLLQVARVQPAREQPALRGRQGSARSCTDP
eukprot:scaffold136931_cov32-Tisochrysis_lutea.AAC.1